MTTVTAVDELDLPAFDYADPSLRGERFHEVLGDRREQTCVARASPVGWFVLDRDAVAHLTRTRSATFPGRKRPGARRRAAVRLAARRVRPRRAADPLVVRA